MTNSTPIGHLLRPANATDVRAQMREQSRNQQAGTRPAPAPAPKPAQTTQPRGNLSIEQANNHGALEDGKFAQSQPGYTGKRGRWATFATPEDGDRAQVNLLRRNYKNMSVAEVIQKYAPLSGENPEASVRNYIGYVASRIGLNPDQKLTDDKYEQLAAAMRAFETGKKGKIQFAAYSGQLRGARAGGGATANGTMVDPATIPNSAVPSATGGNTGGAMQVNRVMGSGGTMEAQQRNVQNRAVSAQGFLDEMITQMGATQETVQAEAERQVETARNINDRMSESTQEMISKAEPVFKRRGEILDQALKIQSMSPIARTVRGIFDLNYNEDFLLGQSEKLGAILNQVGDSYEKSQALHGDALEQSDRLYKINTIMPNLLLEHSQQLAQGAEMQLARAKGDLDITMTGVQNEIGLLSAQRGVRNDLMGRLDLPTLTGLVGQAEQNGGQVVFNGVALSSQELRERAQGIEQHEMSLKGARMALAAGEQDFADNQISRMVEYASDAQIADAIANGGVMNGIQVAPGVLSQAQNNRRQSMIADAEYQAGIARPSDVGNQLLTTARYTTQTMQKAESLFGRGALSQEVVGMSSVVTQLSAKLKDAIARGANPVELAQIQQQLSAASAGFDKSVGESVARMVGNDKVMAGIATSFLKGEQLTRGAAADAMAYAAARGGFPAALKSSVFGANTMQAVQEITEAVKLEAGPNGKQRSQAEVIREVSRRLANPNSAESKRIEAAGAGLRFETKFNRLPEMARDSAGKPTHAFGHIAPNDFQRVVSTAKAKAFAEVAKDYGVTSRQMQAIANGERPEGVDAEKYEKIAAAKGTWDPEIGVVQNMEIAAGLDRLPQVTKKQSNSSLMIDFMHSAQGTAAVGELAAGSTQGGALDWLSGQFAGGGVQRNWQAIGKSYAAAHADYTAETEGAQAKLTTYYRNDPQRWLGSVARAGGNSTFETEALIKAIAPQLPQGTQQERQRMEMAASADENMIAANRTDSFAGNSWMGNTFSYRTNLAQQQIQAATILIKSGKFDDPVAEAARKKLAPRIEELSRMGESFLDGLNGN